MTTSDFIPFALPDVGEAEIEAVVTAMRSGWLTTGPNAKAFEDEFVAAMDPAAHVGALEPRAVAVNSATAGLHLALDKAAAAVTERTKAVMPVHFAGLPVDRAALAAFARRHGLKVVEDAAHSHPVTSHGISVGLGESDAVVFSFYATKTMTTGEGGMVVASDPAVVDRMRTMRLHGISRDVFDRYTSSAPSWHYEVVAPGFKNNLTDTAAAMGRVQLSRSQEMKARRTAIAARYDAAFAGLPLDLPARPARSDTEHAWHLYVLRLHPDAPMDRNTLIEEMAAAGVGTSVHFIPLHHHPYWRDLRGPEAPDLTVADEEFEKAFSLPIFSAMTDAQVDTVIAAVTSLLR